jgi:DNA-binding SARP family transcriptional activator
MLTFTLLGQVLIARDGAPLGRFRSRKEAALLIYLAHTGRAQPREHLADLLWDSHSTKQSLTNLRTALTRLRDKVPGELVVDHRSVALAPNSRPQVDSATLLPTST